MNLKPLTPAKAEEKHLISPDTAASDFSLRPEVSLSVQCLSFSLSPESNSLCYNTVIQIFFSVTDVLRIVMESKLSLLDQHSLS